MSKTHKKGLPLFFYVTINEEEDERVRLQIKYQRSGQTRFLNMTSSCQRKLFFMQIGYFISFGLYLFYTENIGIFFYCMIP